MRRAYKKNEPLRKILFYIVLIFTILIIPILVFGIINTMVSLQYETENLNDCISLVSGQNLCLIIKIMGCLIVCCILVIIGLLTFRRQLLKLN